MRTLKYNNLQHIEVLKEVLDSGKIYLNEFKHDKYRLYYCNGSWPSPKMDTLIGEISIEDPY